MRVLVATKKKAVASLLIFVTALATLVAIPQAPAQALSGSDFQPGNIISDGVFFNGNALDAAGVRASLIRINTNSNGVYNACRLGVNGQKVPGTADPDYPSGNIIYASNCLEDFRETIPSIGGDIYCAPIGGGNFSAPEIIHKVGAACNVSQKALIVLLQKEQSLVTDRFPSTFQYGRATGFNCPDGAPCRSVSAGFFKQVYSAARRFQEYPVDTNRKYIVGQTAQVEFQADDVEAYFGINCGAGPVFIQNRATAALYYYTPYQPNAAALANLGGSGDRCSATGNRNFWVMFNTWFGSTQLVDGSVDYVRAIYADVLGRTASESEVNSWASTLSSGGTRKNIALGFVNSDEYYGIKIREAYSMALGRSPETEGFNYWMNALRAKRLSPEDLYSTFLTSDEMYFVKGGGTNAGYITVLYQQLLGRAPDVDGMNYWMQRLGQTNNRRVVSDGFWYATEKYRLRAQEAFTLYLGRSASSSDQDFWANYAMRFGQLDMRAAIMTSDEYWNRANARF